MSEKMCDAGSFVVCGGPAELLFTDIFMHHGLDDLRPSDNAVPGDEAVTGILAVRQAKVVGTMGDEAISPFKCALVQQELNALAGRHLSFFVLALAALGAATFVRQAVAALKFLQLLLDVHGRGL